MPLAIAIHQTPGAPGKVYYPLTHITLPPPTPQPHELIIHLSAAALNHRDLFIRQHLYPGVAFSIPLLADGCGVVTAAGSSHSAQRWLGKRVMLNPGTGWAAAPEGPESGGYAIMGGTRLNPRGTLAEVVTVTEGEVEEAPRHLSDVEAAALPLAGLTAWRAVVGKSGCFGEGTGEGSGKGKRVLVTGVGGGVALMVVLFADALGCEVWVTSGEVGKIERARGLGAKGGVSYKETGWEKRLLEMLPEGGKYLDAIIDGAGGDIVEKGVKLLKPGGVIVSYGMTLGPKLPFPMSAVMRNIELRGSTMGSRREFKEMMQFVREKKLRPVISRAVKGLEDLGVIDGLFEDMRNGTQFGKLVVQIRTDESRSKL